MNRTPRAYVRARVTEWVSDSPFPGVVRVEMVDAADRTWTFEDKAPMFDERSELSRDSKYPMDIRLACTIVERRSDSVDISTAEPWGLVTIDGVSKFVMKPEQVVNGGGS